MAGEWERVKQTANDGWERVQDFVNTEQAPVDPRVQAQRDLAESTGVGEAMLVGAGRTFDKIGSGTMDLIDMAFEKWGPDAYKADATASREARRKEQESNDAAYKYLNEESPWATGIGEAAPYLATAPLGMATGGARAGANVASHLASKPNALKTAAELAKFLGRESAIGGIEGATHYDDDALSGMAWGAGGALAGKWLGNAMGGNRVTLDGPDKETVKYAKKNGLFLPPGMATGNDRIQQMDQALRTHAGSTEMFNKKIQESGIKSNNIISDEIGMRADYFSDDYFDMNTKRIGNKMDELSLQSSGSFSEEDALRATNILEGFKDVSLDQTVPPLLKRYENMIYDLATSGEPFSGTRYQKIMSELRSGIRKQYGMGGDRDLAKALEDIAGMFDDSIAEGFTNSTAKADWKKANKQYALLKATEKARDKTTTKGAAGVSGFVDADVLSRDFKGSKEIKQLGNVERLRKSQKGASLSTSGMIGKLLNVTNPAEQLGALGLMTNKAAEGMGFGSNLITSAYLKGYPHATGVAPILGREYTEEGVRNLLSRGLMGRTSEEED